jgi:hypothetical protein
MVTGTGKGAAPALSQRLSYATRQYSDAAGTDFLNGGSGIAILTESSENSLALFPALFRATAIIPQLVDRGVMLRYDYGK